MPTYLSPSRITSAKRTVAPADRRRTEGGGKIPTVWMIQIDGQPAWHRVYLAQWGVSGTYFIVLRGTKENVGWSGSREFEDLLESRELTSAGRTYREPVSIKSIGEGVGPKTECSQLMDRILWTIQDRIGNPDLRKTISEGSGDSWTLKTLQGVLVFTVADLASDVRASHGGPSHRVNVKTLLRCELPSMSLEAARWFGDQTDAVQFTLARRTLFERAKLLGVPFDRNATIH